MSPPGYTASARALRELSNIIAQTHQERGVDAADRLEERFFSAFRDLENYQISDTADSI